MFFDNPLEVFVADGVHVGIGRGIEEVDGVGDAFFNGEFDGIQVIAEGATQRERIFDDAIMEHLRTGHTIFDIAEMMRLFGIVFHDADFLLADDVTAKILVEIDACLQSHAERAGLIVGGEEFLARIDFEDVLPAAAAEGLQEGGEANVIKNFIPVQRKSEVAHG